MPAFAADWLTVSEYDSGEGLAILPNNKNELQLCPSQRYCTRLTCLAILTVHVLGVAFVCETTDAGDCSLVISDCGHLS